MFDLNLRATTAAASEDGSSTRHETLSFSILRRADVTGGGGGGASELELFPVSVDSAKTDWGGANKGHDYWLGLSAPAGGNQVVPTQAAKKSRRGPRSRSSQYRGVTFYRRTGRWESHIWDCGKQLYLGGFDTAHAAARAYDRAAIKFRGVEADINFEISDYGEDIKQMKNLTKQEFVQILRRQTAAFARVTSKYRGKFIAGNGGTKMVTPSNELGSGGSLDLSLGISSSSIVPQCDESDEFFHGKRAKEFAGHMWAGLQSPYKLQERSVEPIVPLQPWNSNGSASSAAASSGFSSATKKCSNLRFLNASDLHR